MNTNRLIALDLFAGTGWGVACQRLDIEEYGVEIMDEAVATRDAAGMTTLYRDVWEGLLPTMPTAPDTYDLLIASPPCQTFSVAGKGAGRAALDDVLGAIRFGAYKSGEQLRAITETMDDRTALVLTPLAHAYRDRPMYVVLEQVPTVLPVWDACAEVLRGIGYSVVTGVLNAEQYGVPQTRKRAILFARRDGVAATMPTPTHSRYHTRDADRLDSGVLPWVSMGETLGFYGFTAEKVMGKGMIERYGTRPGRRDTEPAFTIRASAGGMEPGGFVLQPSEPLGGRTDEEVAAWGRTDIPAPTVAGDRRLPRRAFRKGNERQMDGALRLTPAETAALQTYPAGFPFQGSATNKFLQIGNAVPPLLGQAILAPIAAAHALNIETKEAA